LAHELQAIELAIAEFRPQLRLSRYRLRSKNA
jgi:hypothetical protein